MAPLGVGWIWDQALRVRGEAPPSLGMIYWLGLISLGAFVLLAFGFRLPQAFVLAAVSCASLGGWLWHLVPRFTSGATAGGLRRRTDPLLDETGTMRDGVRGTPVSGASVWLMAPFLPLVLAGVAYCVLDPVRVWDAHFIWLARVRLLEQWIPLSRFRELQITYSEYPFLGAAAWWCTQAIGRVPVEAARVVFLFAYVAFFLAALARYSGRWSLGGGALAIFFCYACFGLEIINGYQDGLLMVSGGMVALAFLRWGDRGVAWIAPLAAALSLIKAEGMVIGPLFLLCWIASAPQQVATVWRDPSQARSVRIGTLTFFLLISAWPFIEWRSGLEAGRVQGDAFRIHSLSVFVDQVDRVPAILSKMVSYHAEAPWVAIPFLAAVVSAAFSGTLDRNRRFLLGFVGVHLLFIVIVFWLTQQPFEWHLGSAGGRLLSQGRLVMVLFVCETAVQQWAPLLARARATAAVRRFAWSSGKRPMWMSGHTVFEHILHLNKLFARLVDPFAQGAELPPLVRRQPCRQRLSLGAIGRLRSFHQRATFRGD